MSSDRRTFLKQSGVAVPFLGSGLLWAVLGLGIAYFFGDSSALFWMISLWLLCMLDLLAIGKALASVLVLTGEETPQEKRVPLIIQASYWGMIKLACLGLLGAALMQAQTIPTTGLLPGLGTLVVVPLLGGIWWSQRVMGHGTRF